MQDQHSNLVLDFMAAIDGRNWYAPEERHGQTYRWSGPGDCAEIAVNLRQSNAKVCIKMPRVDARVEGSVLSVYFNFSKISFHEVHDEANVNIVFEVIGETLEPNLIHIITRCSVRDDRVCGIPVNSLSVSPADESSIARKSIVDDAFPFVPRIIDKMLTVSFITHPVVRAINITKNFAHYSSSITVNQSDILREMKFDLYIFTGSNSALFEFNNLIFKEFEAESEVFKKFQVMISHRIELSYAVRLAFRENNAAIISFALALHNVYCGIMSQTQDLDTRKVKHWIGRLLCFLPEFTEIPEITELPPKPEFCPMMLSSKLLNEVKRKDDTVEYIFEIVHLDDAIEMKIINCGIRFEFIITAALSSPIWNRPRVVNQLDERINMIIDANDEGMVQLWNWHLITRQTRAALRSMLADSQRVLIGGGLQPQDQKEVRQILSHVNRWLTELEE